jgi:transcriptional regulator with XRE-family HTH domain
MRVPLSATPLKWQVDVLRLERERVLRGWTRGALAQSARVDPGTVSDLFREQRQPTLNTLQAICTALQMSLEEVIIFVDDKPKG